MNDFKQTLNLRIAATKTWHDQLVKDQAKIVSEKKKEKLQGFIDVLRFWIDIGEYVQKFISK